MSKLILGCGYLGNRVAQLWKQAGHQVIAVTRNAERSQELTRQGLQTLQADVTNPESLKEITQLDSIQTVLFSVGFDRTTNDNISEVYAGGLRNLLAALPSTVQQFIYISTTGVYGPAEGNWVDETTPTNPLREGGQASLAAEQLLAGHPVGKCSAILRLGGIYGPGRIPYLAALRAGEPIAAPSEGWLNLIHVADAAQITLAVDRWLVDQNAANSPHVFCVTDGQPVVRANYYREVARLIAAPEPQFVEPDPSTPAAARARSDKRIRNDKLLRTLNYPFAYPTYQAGLADILNQ